MFDANDGSAAAHQAAMAAAANEKKMPLSPPPTATFGLKKLVGGAPPPGQFTGVRSTSADNVGTFDGGSYRISHRSTNSLLTIQLAMGAPLQAKPGKKKRTLSEAGVKLIYEIKKYLGVMIAMSPTITLVGTFHFSLKKLLIGREMTHSNYKGPGELLLAPHLLGDITVLRLFGDEDKWKVGHTGFLACTKDIKKGDQPQALSKSLFSGEGWFIYTLSGEGLVWLQSFGAIVKKDVSMTGLFLFLVLLW